MLSEENDYCWMENSWQLLQMLQDITQQGNVQSKLGLFRRSKHTIPVI